MIRYQIHAEGLTPDDLRGFFAGWPNAPSPETHLRLLEGSDHVVLAVDDATGHVVGFVTAVSDGVLSAYVPLLEVEEPHRGRGIGKELVRRLLDEIGHLYMVDLACDPELVPFYEALGFQRGTAMLRRRHEAQSGAESG